MSQVEPGPPGLPAASSEHQRSLGASHRTLSSAVSATEWHAAAADGRHGAVEPEDEGAYLVTDESAFHAENSRIRTSDGRPSEEITFTSDSTLNVAPDDDNEPKNDRNRFENNDEESASEFELLWNGSTELEDDSDELEDAFDELEDERGGSYDNDDEGEDSHDRNENDGEEPEMNWEESDDSHDRDENDYDEYEDDYDGGEDDYDGGEHDSSDNDSCEFVNGAMVSAISCTLRINLSGCDPPIDYALRLN